MTIKEPDDDLLSHEETSHYHRRGAVSLLSSGWDQVVPTRYGRQANRDVMAGTASWSVATDLCGVTGNKSMGRQTHEVSQWG